MSLAIHFENVIKTYPVHSLISQPTTIWASARSLFSSPLRNLRELSRLGNLNASGELVYALDQVSLGINKGEVVGLIGRNGSGKTTLLKVVARVTSPSTGWVGINGRVASLLEVGTGFHPELSGRENVFLSGAIMGMKRREILEQYDNIVAYAEIARFMDTPVKRYSSGMFIRLAFAVAAHLNHDVMLVDEVLAVGDVLFQKKCLKTMAEIAGAGRTVLFVSHNMSAVMQLCDRVIWLERGKIVADGLPQTVVRDYLRHSSDFIVSDRLEVKSNKARCIERVRLHDGSETTSVFVTDGPMHCEVTVLLDDEKAAIDLIFTILDAQSTPLITFSSEEAKLHTDLGRCLVSFAFERLPLNPGRYQLDLAMEVGRHHEHLAEPVSFEVSWPTNERKNFDHLLESGPIRVPVEWHCSSIE